MYNHVYSTLHTVRAPMLTIYPQTHTRASKTNEGKKINTPHHTSARERKNWTQKQKQQKTRLYATQA